MCDEDEAVESWSEYNGPPLPLPDPNHWTSWHEPYETLVRSSCYGMGASRREPCCFPTKEWTGSSFPEDRMSEEEYIRRVKEKLAELRP